MADYSITTCRGPTGDTYVLDNEFGPIAETDTLDEAIERARIIGLTEVTICNGGAARLVTL